MDNRPPSQIARDAASSFSEFKDARELTKDLKLSHDENLLLWQIENELPIILQMSEPFDKDNAALAQRLRFIANYVNQLTENIKKLNELDENHPAIKSLRNMSEHIIALQKKQDPHLQDALSVIAKLEAIAKLSPNQQNQLNKLQLQVIKTFNASNMAPEDKLTAIINTLSNAATVKQSMGLHLFAQVNPLQDGLGKIISAFPKIPTSRPTPSGG